MQASVLVVALLMVGGCGGVPVLSGSGEVATETRDIDDFDRLQVDSAFDVAVREGEPGEVELRVSENALDDVIVAVDDGTLRIGLDRRFFTVRNATLEAEVTASDLRAIEASGSSQITLEDPLEVSELEVGLSGASGFEGEIAVDRLVVMLSGASTLELGGSVDEGSVEASGASSLDLAGLTFRSLNAELSGASSGEVDVTDELAVQLSGASDLSYAGDPQVVDQSITGASSLEPAD